MFTGLIEGTGTLLHINRQGSDARMIIRADYVMEGVSVGESIAVDGACLTVVSFQGNTFTADVSVETLGRTTLGRKSPGARFNLERALRAGDRLGGHLVMGHVDGIGALERRHAEGRSLRLFFRIPEDLGRYTIEKGSVAVNGVSLTINGCEEGRFDVNIVPHTAQETTLESLKIGEEVNIETDLIGKYVERMLKSWKTAAGKDRNTSRIDLDFLMKHGFAE